MSGVPRSFLATIAGLGIVLTATVIPGVFIIDEPNYLMSLVALRDGRLTAPGTEGLPASREVAWFDPAGESRVVLRTPVASTAPPLWAFLALPLSYAGWRGLVALNTLAFVATAVLVFRLARGIAERDSAGWWAAAAFVLGGFGIEYSQGLWPHSLSVLLVFAAVVLVLGSLRAPDRKRAAAAGALLGVATGIRYQNFVVAIATGALFLVLGSARLRTFVAYVSGYCVPLLCSSAVNFARYGTLNPISKGAGYLRVGSGSETPIADFFLLIWTQLVDFSARPAYAPPSLNPWIARSPLTDAWLVGGEIKKALLQSAPWVALGIVAMAIALSGRRRELTASRHLGIATLFIGGALVSAFALAGRSRHDGLAYNARYLLELVPMAAALAGVLLAEFVTKRVYWLAGGAAGAGLAAATLWSNLGTRSLENLILYLPLGLASALVVTSLPRHWWLRQSVPILAAMAIGWSFTVHMETDLSASRARRETNLRRAEQSRLVFPPEAAVFAWWGQRDQFGSLVLDQPLVVINPSFDDGATAAEVAAALRLQKRRIFILREAMPRSIVDAIAAGREVRQVQGPDGKSVALEVL